MLMWKGSEIKGRKTRTSGVTSQTKGGLYYDQYNLTKSKLTTAFSVLLQRARSLPPRPLRKHSLSFLQDCGAFF